MRGILGLRYMRNSEKLFGKSIQTSIGNLLANLKKEPKFRKKHKPRAMLLVKHMEHATKIRKAFEKHGQWSRKLSIRTDFLYWFEIKSVNQKIDRKFRCTPWKTELKIRRAYRAKAKKENLVRLPTKGSNRQKHTKYFVKNPMYFIEKSILTKVVKKKSQPGLEEAVAETN